MPKKRRQAASAPPPSPPPAAALSRSMLVVAGDWLINVHLKRFDPPPTPQQITRLLRNPKLLAETVRQACSESPTAIYEPLPIPGQPHTRTRECLAIIDEAVRAAPLEGIPLVRVRQLLAERLDHHLCHDHHLRAMITRHYALHQLRCFRGNVCLRADITIMQIARSRREQLARKQVRQLRVMEVA